MIGFLSQLLDGGSPDEPGKESWYQIPIPNQTHQKEEYGFALYPDVTEMENKKS